ncbi:MAG TPA: serine hydrolase domain-containing protein [Acidobacteriaceae bacterium]|jgi:CubicO group peptidase (beta-lactamase class C family)|nr:serine hydrolase domain-containing protein [Acidobacteriaceae bacterium]
MRLTALITLALGFFTNIPALTAQVSQPQVNRPKVDQIFAAYNNADSPGCALGVIQNGNFIYRKGYGQASLELGVPLSPESVFYMGSVSKQFTAASIVLLSEQGRLSLDDDVRKYIPELPDYGHTITLREMLHHTSGLRDFLTLTVISGRHYSDIHSQAEMLKLVERQKGLNNIPGEEYIYSNTNFFLLGVVVQRVSKMSLADFAAENIFQPLGMTHTRFYDDRTVVVPNRVAAYAPGDNGKFLVDWSTSYDTVGAGGLMSTVDDLLLWDRNFYNNKLGNGPLIQEMETRGVLNNGQKISYALGLEIGAYRGLPTVEHNGALFGYRTIISRFPQQHFTVVALCNLSSALTSNLAHKVADVYLAKDLAPVPAAQTSNNPDFPNPARFAGTYLDTHKQILDSFTAADGTLSYRNTKLRRVSANQFTNADTGTITFDDAHGSMQATVETHNGTAFTGSRIEAPRLSADALAEFAGHYQSEELDTTYNLSIDNGTLTLRCNWNPPLKLTPIAPDEFNSGDYGILVFHRDANHRISGFSVYTLNVRNVGFTKTS